MNKFLVALFFAILALFAQAEEMEGVVMDGNVEDVVAEAAVEEPKKDPREDQDCTEAIPFIGMDLGYTHSTLAVVENKNLAIVAHSLLKGSVSEKIAALKDSAEAFQGSEAKNVVISVPIATSKEQIEVISEAATASGFARAEIISAPIASCIAYGLDAKTYYVPLPRKETKEGEEPKPPTEEELKSRKIREERKFLVVQLEANFFDVSIIGHSKTGFKILAGKQAPHKGIETLKASSKEGVSHILEAIRDSIKPLMEELKMESLSEFDDAVFVDDSFRRFPAQVIKLFLPNYGLNHAVVSGSGRLGLFFGAPRCTPKGEKAEEKAEEPKEEL